MPTAAPRSAPTPEPDGEADDASPGVERQGEGEGGVVTGHGRWTSLAFSSQRNWQALTRSLEGTSADQPWDLRGIECDPTRVDA